MRMREKYGDIFLVPVGIRHVLLLHDYELIKEAYAKVSQSDSQSVRQSVSQSVSQ